MLKLREISSYLQDGYQLQINKKDDKYNGVAVLYNNKNSVRSIETVDVEEPMKIMGEVASVLLPGRTLVVSYDRETEFYNARIVRKLITGVSYKGKLSSEVVDNLESVSMGMVDGINKLNKKIMVKRNNRSTRD